MKIAVLGLSADPITTGHIALAEQVSKLVDEVWLMPCFGHMYGKVMAPARDRMRMCQLAVHGKRDIMLVCSWEIYHQSSGIAYDTVLGMKSFYKDDFFWVIGSDNADSISKWKNWEQLIKTVPFIVAERPGHILKGGWYDQRPHQVIKVPGPEISSTAVRTILKSGGDPTELVSPKVLEYIKANNLYANNNNG